MTRKRKRIQWGYILDRARVIIEGYETQVTLRQLFYRLVAAELIPNKQTAYQTLSARTAEARRAGQFPQLLDRTREIHRDPTFADTEDAIEWLCKIYRRDRTEGQTVSVYIGIEKHGIVEQLRAWFGNLGIPILSLGGYASQTYVDKVREDVDRQGRPSVLLYAGDFDPSGEDIPRDFTKRVGSFDTVERIALSPEQVEEYQLPPQPGKASDSRAPGFIARHGELVQVEVDALPPDVLRSLYQNAIDPLVDMSILEDVLALEASERDELNPPRA